MQVHKCIAYKHLSVVSIRLKHVWIYCIVRVSIADFCLHNMESSVCPPALPALMLYSFAPVFLIDFDMAALLYGPAFQTVVPLTVSALCLVPPVFVSIPATTCSFYSLLFYFIFCFTLPCLSVLDGTSFTHHSIRTGNPLVFIFQLLLSSAVPAAFPQYGKA